MKRISGDEGDGSPDQAWGTEHAKEGMIRRISTWDRPKLISRHKGWLGASGRRHVVPELRQMHVAQRGDYSEFDDDLVLDCQVLVKKPRFPAAG
jgi:hypothetical protein